MDTSPRVVIIGGGPIGLEAAAYGRAAGMDVALLERQDVGANVAGWGFLRMFTPWHLNTTPLGRELAGGDPVLGSDACPTGQEFVDQYLRPMADSPLLEGVVEVGAKVLAVGREFADAAGGEAPDGGKAAAACEAAAEGGNPVGRGLPSPPAPRRVRPFRLLVCDRFGVEQFDRADVVLDCTGTYGNRRWAGRGGMPAVGEVGARSAIWYTVPDVLGADRPRFAGRRTLLIGAGTSALTVLSHLALVAGDDPSTRVVWALQGWGQVLGKADQDPLPPRRALAAAALHWLADPPPWLEVMEGGSLEQIDVTHGLRVALRAGGGVESRRVDEVVAAIGHRPDESTHEALPARPTYATSSAARAALDAGDLRRPAADAPLPMAGPGYFLLGHKSYGTDGNFLLRAGHQQVREAFRQITGDPSLDLYRLPAGRAAALALA